MAGSMSDILSFIRDNGQFTVLSHTSPDGDTLGSALGLVHMLRAMGKEAEAVCSDPVPGVYSFLPGAEEVKVGGEGTGYAAVIAVDCADKCRFGRVAKFFDGAKTTANIDHHGTNDMYACANWMEETAACAELVYRLVKELNVELTIDMATCLLTGLMTDTGCFAYSNVTEETMVIAGALIGAGADNSEINMAVYHNSPYCRSMLQAEAVSRAKLYCGGRLALTTVTLEDMARHGAKPEYCDGIVEQLRDIDTVEIAVFIREDTAKLKGSLRAKRYADVSRMASMLGGGGHKRAAGYTCVCPMDEAVETILRLGEEELERCWKE
ncbi:MAG: bifunctional oligoribonuclease/PAP phosphatase NrnA [Clostridia bacterium]|nr:bifunctional oligoribonuclease/PAP phosphatase NrnA [Clostridia bacterium]